MKILHTSDWHIGKSINDYSLLEDQKYWLDGFTNKLKEIHPDILVIAGDIYDRSVPSADAITLLNDTLSEIVLNQKIKTIIIAGNHDSKQRLSFANEFLSKSGLYIIGDITTTPTPISIDYFDFWPIPYIEPHNVKMLFPETSPKLSSDAIKIYVDKIKKNINYNKVNIIIAHGTFLKDEDGLSKVGGSDSVNIGVFDDFDLTLLGHFHGYTKVSNKAFFSGSPIKYSVNEASNKNSVNLITIDDKKYFDIERIYIYPLRDLKVSEGYFSSFIDSNNQDDDYIFINLCDESIVLNAMSRLKAIYNNLLGIKYKNIKSIMPNENHLNTEKISQLSENELFETFFKEIAQRELSKDEKDYINSVFLNLQGDNL